jgi:hypothetical protein
VCVLAGTVTLSGDSLGGPLGASAFQNQNIAMGAIDHFPSGDGYGWGLCVLGGTVTLTNDELIANTPLACAMSLFPRARCGARFIATRRKRASR